MVIVVFALICMVSVIGVSSQHMDLVDRVKHVPSQKDLQESFEAENVVAIGHASGARIVLMNTLLSSRVFSSIFSGISIVFLSPLFLLVCVLIRLESSGVAISAIECLSPRARKFDAVSFRCTAMINNIRVPTHVGAALQRLRLAHLPLLFNVLQGHISLGEVSSFGDRFARSFNETKKQRAHKDDKSSVFLGSNRIFWVAKRLFDITGSLVLLPLLGLSVMSLLILNPLLNPGKLLFIQKRMGKECRPFYAIKFRSMRAVDTIERGPNDPVEVKRITPLGKFLRRSRLDELPQILNVVFGEMSLIGPRPDYYSHAIDYLKNVPGYRERHVVRPGISGLAQVDLGYIEGTEATRKKVNADHHYINEAGFVQEGTLVVKTIVTVLARAGA
ncbi:MAG: sugar transferase [Rhizobiaceae bacterium]